MDQSHFTIVMVTKADHHINIGKGKWHWQKSCALKKKGGKKKKSRVSSDCVVIRMDTGFFRIDSLKERVYNDAKFLQNLTEQELLNAPYDFSTGFYNSITRLCIKLNKFCKLKPSCLLMSHSGKPLPQELKCSWLTLTDSVLKGGGILLLF